MTGFGRIVVGVDFRDGGADALALAKLLRTGDDDLVAAYIYPFDRSVSLDGAEQEEADLLDEIAARVAGELLAAGARARPVVVADSHPARALHALARRLDAGLVVIGYAHREGVARLLLGDTAGGLIPGAPCAVAVAPQGFGSAEHRLATIGVGYDDSQEARAALDLAAGLSRRTGAELRVCTVAPPPQMAAVTVPETGVHTAGEARVGDAGAELARCSRELDLLVLGSRSHGPVRRLLLGSTSSTLVRRAACPVLVLPRTAAPPDA